MPRLDPRDFDPAKPLVMGRFNTVGGHALAAGDPLTIADEPKERGEITVETATRLWTGGTIVYADKARPTPVESAQDAARRLLATEDLGGGHHLIRLPWLPGGSEKVQGRDKLEARVAELIEAGQPEDFDPNAVAVVNANTDSSGTGTRTDDTSTRTETGDPEQRVKALVDGNSEKELRDRIEQIDQARAARDQEPLGMKSDHNKTDLARLIVLVDGDTGDGVGPAADATETGGDNSGGKTQSEG